MSNKFAEVNQKIEETVVSGYKKIEDSVVGGYKKIEEGAVEGFQKISDKFIDNFLILVVEDDVKLNHIVCTYLNDNGFAAKGCLNANEAYNEMYNSMYQLIISDIMMPEIDGFEFARTVRKITVGNLELDADAMSAEIDGEEINLTTREFNIIYKMLSYPKKTFSRAQLMDEFWDIDSDTSLRAVDVYVTKLRDKLSACDGFKIVTVRGLGYKVVLT